MKTFEIIIIIVFILWVIFWIYIFDELIKTKK
jgi:hypothetical protein